MNVVVFAARKGGSGKSTLAAHLAASRPARSCLLIDADPQGSLSLWHRLRGDDDLVLRRANRGVGDIVKATAKDGHDWVLVDTPPTMSALVADAVRAATLVVIPARPTIFDISAVGETVRLCRELNKPYAVVLNGAPARRNEAEAPVVAEARAGLVALGVPLWSGQVTHRATYAMALAKGEGVAEFDAQSHAAAEMASLWSAIEKSVGVINGAHRSSAKPAGPAMRRAAA